jgi:hypothetical protein
MPKISRLRKPDTLTQSDLTQVAVAVSSLLKVKDSEVQNLAAGLKGELVQLIRDVKTGYITSRGPDVVPDYYERLNTAIKKANSLSGDTEEAAGPDFSGPWTWKSGDLSTGPSGADDDLKTLVKRKPNVFRNKIGTVVGGNAIRTGTKVSGLNHQSARIDMQSPPKSGVFNVQFQTGEDSHACVIFAPEDDAEEVFKHLLESYKKKQKAISPRAQHVMEGA